MPLPPLLQMLFFQTPPKVAPFLAPVFKLVTHESIHLLVPRECFCVGRARTAWPPEGGWVQVGVMLPLSGLSRMLPIQKVGCPASSEGSLHLHIATVVVALLVWDGSFKPKLRLFREEAFP